MINKQHEIIIEGIILSCHEPVSINLLHEIMQPYHSLTKDEIKTILQNISISWNDKALVLVEVSGGWRFQTREMLAQYMQGMQTEKKQKYSRATMEILSIIAYKQPVTRGDIELVRGVGINTNSIKLLEERGWIEVIGQREVAGRPNLYGTTSQFLNDLGLLSLQQLPILAEISNIE
jgi:segregation and condensation protein B